MSGAYPAHREADVALKDGSTVRVRPVRHDDEQGLLELLRGLSPEAKWLRFFAGAVDLERMAHSAVRVDYRDRYGLVATLGLDHRVVAHAVYLRTAPDRAEVAFAVADDLQGHGLGTILLGHLTEAAQENGIAVFEAEVLPDNHRMIEVFRDSGFPLRMRSEPGVIRVEFPASLTSEALDRFEDRERVATVAALRAFLAPRAVAVVGASRTRGTIGAEIFHNLLEAGFKGPVYPVNPKAEVVQSVAAYPSIRDVPGAVDLAVIVVPAEAVMDVARECARAGVRSLVVISAGFAEAGNVERQQELLELCRSSGMRLIGPNCMGILNTDTDVRLNATFAPVFPPHGRVGFLSQSGALGLAVIEHADQLGLGISSFVSVGNKADISGNDLLQYWESDESTDLALLYLESFGNPRKFSRIARRVGRVKPILAVKSGRSSAGARATSSHTGALIAASDVTVDALFRQAGVIRTDTLAELFDAASLMANQPLPAGGRVAIVTNAGGPGILCADACEANGLEVPPLTDGVQRELASFLPGEASWTNPVDMIASASGEDYRRTIEAVARSEDVDAIIVIFIPPLVTRAEDVARAIRAAADGIERELPLLSVFMSARGVPRELQAEGARIPSYAFPEDAARALAHAARFAGWRAQPEAAVPVPERIRPDEAAGVVSSALARGEGWMTPEETERLLACYGLPLAESRVGASPDAAAAIAGEMGGDVALKAIAPDLVHKTEARAVRLGLAGEEQVRRVARKMSEDVARAGHEVSGFLVQRMVTGGVEMLVGVVHDPVFGPVVACGAGGTAVELLKDVQVRIAPLTDRDAAEMLRSLATFPLLDGYRGAKPVDVGALEDVLLRVSTLVEHHPEVVEMDCNPVIARPDGATIVDARVRVERSEPPLPLAGRRRGGTADREA